MKTLCVPALVAGSMIFAGSVVHAQTVTGDMIVSAYVGQACSLSANPLAFGAVAQVEDYVITTKVTLECSSPGALTTFLVGKGRNSEAANVRNMASGSNRIPYTLHLVGTETPLAHDGAVSLVQEGTEGYIYSVEIEGRLTLVDAEDGVYLDLVTLTTQYDFN